MARAKPRDLASSVCLEQPPALPAAHATESGAREARGERALFYYSSVVCWSRFEDSSTVTLSPLLDALSLLPFDSRASIDDASDSSSTSFKPLSSSPNGRNLIILNCISTDEARNYVFVLFLIATLTRSIEFAILYAPPSAAFSALSRLTPIRRSKRRGHADITA